MPGYLMLNPGETLDVYELFGTVMPLPASIVAALRATVVHAAPAVAPLPQYEKPPEPAVAAKLNVPFVLSVRVPPVVTEPAMTCTPEILTSLAITPLAGSDTTSV